MTLPSLFLSHGSPMLPFTDAPARDNLMRLGQLLPRPKAIVVASAHWDSDTPAVNAVSRNDTIHDFYGFPRQLYELSYPAPGSPQLAETVRERLQAAGFACDLDRRRGLDHGAWIPLLLMYPQADIPVLQVAIQPHLDPDHHYRLGLALAPLRKEDVLVIGSGSFTHNLMELRRGEPLAPEPVWVTAFADWIDGALRDNRIGDLLAYRTRAPHAQRNHPTDEHLLPLYVALGAGGPEAQVARQHASLTLGALRMDVYGFGTLAELAGLTPRASAA